MLIYVTEQVQPSRWDDPGMMLVVKRLGDAWEGTLLLHGKVNTIVHRNTFDGVIAAARPYIDRPSSEFTTTEAQPPSRAAGG